MYNTTLLIGAESLPSPTYTEPQLDTPTISTPALPPQPHPTSHESPPTSTDPSTTASITLSSELKPQPTSTSPPPEDITSTDGAATPKALLESKYIFGIVVVIVVLFVVVLLIAVAIVAVLHIIRSRKKNTQFVDTFIVTSDNEAYKSRMMALSGGARSNSRAQNVARNFKSNTIAISGNMASLTRNETSEQQSNTTHPVTDSPDLNQTRIQMRANEAYHTERGTMIHGLPGNGHVLTMSPSSSDANITTNSQSLRNGQAKVVEAYATTRLPGAEQVEPV